MKAGTQERFLAFPDRLAQPDDDRLLLRAHREKARTEKNHHEHTHHDLDDPETAAQRLGEGLRPGIHRQFRRRRLLFFKKWIRHTLVWLISALTDSSTRHQKGQRAECADLKSASSGL